MAKKMNVCRFMAPSFHMSEKVTPYSHGNDSEHKPCYSMLRFRVTRENGVYPLTENVEMLKHSILHLMRYGNGEFPLQPIAATSSGWPGSTTRWDRRTLIDLTQYAKRFVADE